MVVPIVLELCLRFSLLAWHREARQRLILVLACTPALLQLVGPS